MQDADASVPFNFLLDQGQDSLPGMAAAVAGSYMISARDAVERDLESYLKQVRGARDEDGTPAVHFPSNFDSVVSLMGRQDLGLLGEEGGGGKGMQGMEQWATKGQAAGRGVEGTGAVATGETMGGWTKYALQEGLDAQGPFAKYRGIFADETNLEDEIRRGLAKIQHLDLVLAAKLRRAKEVAAERATASRQAGGIATREAGEGKGERAREGARRTGRGGKALADEELYGDVDSERPSSSDSRDSGLGGRRWKKDKAFLTQRGNLTDEPGTARGRKGKGRRNHIKENMERVAAGGKALTAEQEERVQRILQALEDSAPEANAVLRELELFGLTAEDEENLAEIDRKLEELGARPPPRVAAWSIVDLVGGDGCGTVALEDGRRKRAVEDRLKDIDGQLQVLGEAPLMLEDVHDGEWGNASDFTPSTASGTRTSGHCEPRPVSATEIARLINQSKHSLGERGTETEGDKYAKPQEEGLRLRCLLAELKPEVESLAEKREKKREEKEQQRRAGGEDGKEGGRSKGAGRGVGVEASDGGKENDFQRADEMKELDEATKLEKQKQRRRRRAEKKAAMVKAAAAEKSSSQILPNHMQGLFRAPFDDLNATIEKAQRRTELMLERASLMKPVIGEGAVGELATVLESG